MESMLSKKLKNFFTVAKETYGDDMAFAMAIDKDDILESLNLYSSYRFNGYSTEDIYKELIKNELISNNVMLPITKSFIDNDEINEIFTFIDSNENYKATLIRSFINNAHKKNDYSKVKDYTDKIDSFIPEHSYGKVLSHTKIN